MPRRREHQAKYVYCIIDGDRGKVFGQYGIGDSDNQVYTIPYWDISSVVSDVPQEPLELTREHVLAHESVIEEVMAEHTVLPLRFGTVLASEARVSGVLEKNYRSFKENLARLNDKVELGLKVLWGEDEARREVERASERVARFLQEMADRAQELKRVQGTPRMRGKSYYLRMKLEKDVTQLGSLLQEELQTAREREALHIFRDLRKLAVDACSNDLLDRSMILNAAFLVSRGKCGGFNQRVEMLKRANAERGMELVSSGPWPPYNFVRLEDGK